MFFELNISVAMPDAEGNADSEVGVALKPEL